MSPSQKRAWLIAYDFTDPRRLVRVHQFLRLRTAAVQYSVFAGLLNERELGNVVAGLRGLIDGRRDDVRLYPLPERCETVVFGRCALPEGVWLGSERLLRLMRQTAPQSAGVPPQARESEETVAVDAD